MSEVTERLKQRIVREGIASVKTTERGAKLVGGIYGFLLAQTLATKADFERVLAERTQAQWALMNDHSLNGLYLYWVHRSATVQLEFVFDRLNVFWHFETPPEQRGVWPLSATAVLHTHALMSR